MIRGCRSRWPRRIRQLALALALAGCSKSRPLTTAPNPQPGATALETEVHLVEQCWNHRNIDAYAGLFADDYGFAFASTDSSGNAFQGQSMSRLDELESARHLFIGGGPKPPADSISLAFDQNLVQLPDPRPGKGDARYHRQVVSNVLLRIYTSEGDFRVTGVARFFLVRGDSAVIPMELIDRGIGPDSTRWYIQRWEDETVTEAMTDPID